MGKEDVGGVYIYTHTDTQWNIPQLSKNEIMPFAAMWTDLDIIILRKRQISGDVTHIWNLTNNKLYRWTCFVGQRQIHRFLGQTYGYLSF